MINSSSSSTGSDALPPSGPLHVTEGTGEVRTLSISGNKPGATLGVEPAVASESAERPNCRDILRSYRLLARGQALGLVERGPDDDDEKYNNAVAKEAAALVESLMEALKRETGSVLADIHTAERVLSQVLSGKKSSKTA